MISLDRDYIAPIEGAHVLSNCDIAHDLTCEKVKSLLGGAADQRRVDSVISDMAPNCTGQSTFDHDNIVLLQRKALGVARQFLQEEKGVFLCKLWFGDLVNEFQSELSKHFAHVKIVKPKASRDDSAEVFLFCSSFKSK